MVKIFHTITVLLFWLNRRSLGEHNNSFLGKKEKPLGLQKDKKQK